MPPKKVDIEPRPEIVDDAKFEESDIVDVRARSFPASASFFDQGFTSQFGEDNEENWEDEDDDEFDHFDTEPQCPNQ